MPEHPFRVSSRSWQGQELVNPRFDIRRVLSPRRATTRGITLECRGQAFADGTVHERRFPWPATHYPSPCLVVELVEQGESKLSPGDPADPPGSPGIGTPPDAARRYCGAEFTGGGKYAPAWSHRKYKVAGEAGKKFADLLNSPGCDRLDGQQGRVVQRGLAGFHPDHNHQLASNSGGTPGLTVAEQSARLGGDRLHVRVSIQGHQHVALHPRLVADMSCGAGEPPPARPVPLPRKDANPRTGLTCSNRKEQEATGDPAPARGRDRRTPPQRRRTPPDRRPRPPAPPPSASPSPGRPLDGST